MALGKPFLPGRTKTGGRAKGARNNASIREPEAIN
jgi:hypothetical protein